VSPASAGTAPLWAGFLTILPAIAEPSMVLYLLVMGVRNVKRSTTETRILAAA